MTLPVIVRCLPGLEPLVTEELITLGYAPRGVGRGYVLSTATDVTALLSLNLLSRFADTVALELYAGPLLALEELTAKLAALDCTFFLGVGQTFAVRGERHGTHAFTSMDLARAAASGIGRAYRHAYGVMIRADLKNPDLEIIAWLDGDELTVGVNTSGAPLAKRAALPFAHYAPLYGTIAAAMLAASHFHEHGQLLDPMCGGGNILLEAWLLAKGLPPSHFRTSFAFERHPYFSAETWDRCRDAVHAAPLVATKIVGADRYWGKVRGMEQNMKSLGIDAAIEGRQGSAYTLSYLTPDEIPLAVVNPPYGVRIMNAREVDELYRGFAQAARVKEIREVVSVTPRRRQWLDAFAEAGYEGGIVRHVDYHGVPVAIMRHALP